MTQKILTSQDIAGTVVVNSPADLYAITLRSGMQVPAVRFQSADGLTTYGTVLGLTTGLQVDKDPTANLGIATKQYVDGQVATKLDQSAVDARVTAVGDPRYVNVAGDTMSGTLVANPAGNSPSINVGNANNTPYIGFWPGDLSSRYGFVQGLASGMLLAADAATSTIRLRVGAVDTMTIEDNVVRTSKPIYATGAIRSFSGNNGLILAGPAGTGPQAYIGLYGEATDVNTLGTRSGYIGFPNSTNLYVKNEQAGIILSCASGNIDFYPGAAAYAGRFTAAGDFLVNKTALDTTTIGVALYNVGRVYATAGSATSYNFLSNIVSAVDNNVHMSLRRSDVIVGSILMNGTAGVTYATSSDGRFKHVLGEISDAEALGRLIAYHPVRYQWKLDANQTPAMDGNPSGRIEWGLIAQEAIEVNDVATNLGVGEPYQTDFEMMSMDYGRITPDLIAACQAMLHRIEALEAQVASLTA